MPDVPFNVKAHILMDHYGKASSIDWFKEGEEFRNAVQRNLIDADPPYDVRWSGQKLKGLNKALLGLDRFLETDEGNSFMADKGSGPTEADDLDFWKEYL